MHGFGEVGFLAEAGALQDLALELEGGLVKEVAQFRVRGELGEGRFVLFWGAVAGKVYQVYWSRTRKGINQVSY